MNKNEFFLNLNSDDRISGGISDCFFNLSNAKNLYGKPCEISIVNVSYPNTWYQITSSNNSIKFGVGANLYNASISSGSYTIAQIQTNLKSAMETACSSASTFTFTYSNITNKLSLSSSVAGAVYSTGTTIASVLGFYQDGTIQGINNVATVFPYQINLLPNYAINVNCDLINNNDSLSTNSTVENNKNFLLKLYHVGGYFSRLFFSYSQNENFKGFCSNFKPSFRIFLTDRNNNIVEMDSNNSWQMTLKIKQI